MNHERDNDATTIKLGVSACLLGERVRFDGGHKRSGFITQTLASNFELVPLCPETAIGLGVPREPIRLVRQSGHIRAIGVKTSTLDTTKRLLDYGRETGLKLRNLSGFILKKGSPSCGLERVKLYCENGHSVGHTTGLFTKALLEQQPLLPCEEEGRLNDPRLRESFFKRVYAYHDWQQRGAQQITPSELIRFHTEHKFSLLAHDETRYRQLGRLVASATQQSIHTIAPRYIALVMETLTRPTSRKRHSNVLLHIAGFLKRTLTPDDKKELLATVDAYVKGHIPLIVPITLINHFQRLHRNPYLTRQRYLRPYPDPLQLHNLV